MKVNLIYDLDGTLVASAPDIHDAVNRVLADLDMAALPYDTVVSFIGNGVPKLMERVMRAVEIAHTDVRHAELVTAFTAHYAANPATLSYLNKGALKTLDYLRAEGHKMAICTNKPYGLTMQVLQGLEITDYFAVVIGGDSLPVKKPDAAPLVRAMELLEQDSCIYIGDSEVDAQTAQNAGQPFFLFTDGYRKTAAADLGADAQFDDFVNLPVLINEYSGL